MGSDTDHTKSIRVSDETHQELSIRKSGNESFDDVLQRELGLTPQSIDELTTVLPTRLAKATNILVTNYINNCELFDTKFIQDEAKQTLQFVSRFTNRIIYEVSVYYPSSEKERVNHRVDIRYRNPQNDLDRIVQLRDTEEGAVDINYKDFDTRETKPTTRKGENSGEETAKDIGEHVSQFVELAIDRWGGDIPS